MAPRKVAASIWVLRLFAALLLIWTLIVLPQFRPIFESMNVETPRFLLLIWWLGDLVSSLFALLPLAIAIYFQAERRCLQRLPTHCVVGLSMLLAGLGIACVVSTFMPMLTLVGSIG